MENMMEYFEYVSHCISIISVLYILIMLAHMNYLYKYKCRVFVIKSMMPTLVFITICVGVIYYEMGLIQNEVHSSKTNIVADLQIVNKCLSKTAQINANYYHDGLDNLETSIIEAKYIL